MRLRWCGEPPQGQTARAEGLYLLGSASQIGSGATASPSALARLLAQEGPGALARYWGHYALAWQDGDDLVLHRDRLGCEPLFYRVQGQEICVAQRPWELPSAGHDDQGAVSLLLPEASPSRHTVAAGVRQVLPGETLHWQTPHPTPRRAHLDWPAGADSTYEDSLQGALARTIGNKRRAAIMLSSGVDSAQLAALSPPGTVACSWQVSASEADEGEAVAALAAALDLPLRQTPPLALDLNAALQGAARWPIVNPYWPLIEAVYALAREAGCEVVVSGHGGDAVHAASPSQAFTSAVRAGRLVLALAWLRQGWPGVGLAHRLRGGRLQLPDWLTPQGRAAATPTADSDHPGRLRGQWENLYLEDELAAQHGLERVHPFLDHQVIATLAATPAWRRRSPAYDKPLARALLARYVPRHMAYAARRGHLAAVFDAAFFSNPNIAALLHERARLWPEYVDKARVHALWAAGPAIRSREKLLLWHCACLAQWSISREAD